MGQRVADTRHVLDRHGASLTTALLPGDGWRTQHDALKWCIFEDAKEMGARCRVEVYGLFAACMPQDGRAGGRHAVTQTPRANAGLPLQPAAGVESSRKQRSARQEGGVRVPLRSACGFAPLSAHARMMRVPNALVAS